VIRAAVDIGTNTVRLLVVDDEGNDLERRYVVAGLGRGVDATRTFQPEAVERALDTLAGYREAIDRHGAIAVRAVATSATRDVVDGEAFLDAAEAVLGVRPEVISGEAEALLSFAGGTREAVEGSPALVIDVGGGSTEFVYGTNEPEYATSIDMGSVRITERTLPDRPASPEHVAAARAEADRALSMVDMPGPVGSSVGVGGTFTTLATLSRGLPYNTSVEGERLTFAEVGLLIDRLAGLTIEGTAALDGIDPARAPVILGGAIVVERAMAAAGLDELLVTEHDLLDGIALSLG
jgi:exopolyphosphatase/guanosine-5'-triphosphate,3'-diphosphate pyrophosphatase